MGLLFHYIDGTFDNVDILYEALSQIPPDSSWTMGISLGEETQISVLLRLNWSPKVPVLGHKTRTEKTLPHDRDMDSYGLESSFSWTDLILGIVSGAAIAFFVWLVIGRADTRPVKEGFTAQKEREEMFANNKTVQEAFLSQPVKGTTGVACGQMSSDAEAVYGLFASRSLTVGEEGDQDLRDLRDLLSKMCCFKRDLMSPAQTVTAARELGFKTHQDIQPVAELTACCFAKTVPERDISIQFEKWRDAGLDLIRRLCTAGSFSESDVETAESRFMGAWKDIYDVAKTSCLGGVPKMNQGGPHDPAPYTPGDVEELPTYEGPGARY